jgi:hypothetical protein
MLTRVSKLYKNCRPYVGLAFFFNKKKKKKKRERAWRSSLISEFYEAMVRANRKETKILLGRKKFSNIRQIIAA